MNIQEILNMLDEDIAKIPGHAHYVSIPYPTG